MFRNVSLLLFILLFCSCVQNTILPKTYNLKEDSKITIGLVDITIFTIKNYDSINLSNLIDFPKSNYFDKFTSFEWTKLDCKSNSYLRLSQIISSSKEVTADDNQIQYIEKIMRKIEANEANYYIAGLYKPARFETFEYNHYYFHYILDLKEKKLIVFDQRYAI